MLRTRFRYLSAVAPIFFVAFVVGAPLLAGAACVSSANGTCLDNPLAVSTICGLLQKILSGLLALGTPVAVLFLVYAGFKFVTARGNAEKITSAKESLLYVLIGIALFIGAWLLGQIIANTLNALQPGTVSGSNSCQ